jgi:GDP-4-dehydro-6-deoxy-D-mannose reductase
VDYGANVLGAMNLLDCILIMKKKVRVLLIGSAAEYGEASKESKYISENHHPNPVSIYGLTKVFQTNLMMYYINNYALDIVMARPFNLYGEGISTKLFVGHVYDQIKEYKEKKIERVIVGSLDARRDYIHVSDAVKDYKLIMEKGLSGNIYNVGSGKAIVLLDLLKSILKENGLDMNAVEILDFASSRVTISAANITKLNKLKKEKEK